MDNDIIIQYGLIIAMVVRTYIILFNRYIIIQVYKNYAYFMKPNIFIS